MMQPFLMMVWGGWTLAGRKADLAERPSTRRVVGFTR